MTSPHDQADQGGTPAPETAAEQLQDSPPPATEAEREAQETVRSISRLEEAN